MEQQDPKFALAISRSVLESLAQTTVEKHVEKLKEERFGDHSEKMNEFFFTE